jgi:hypothetical protein
MLVAGLAAGTAPARAGEVIGSTYISEKDGVIEITAEGWNIKDAESPGQFKLAELTPKQAIGGTNPNMQVFRLANPGGAISGQFMLQQIREGLVKQGMEAGQIETRRIGGKRVLTLLASMIKDGGKANGLVYMFEGEKSLYWVQFFANAVVWDEARQRFDEVMEKVKY